MNRRVSVIILAKNEEKMIRNCLESISWADEIILIDDFSDDKTIEIARNFKAKIYQKKAESFSEKRNFGAKKASGDWIFYLDADERVTPELKNEILRVLRKENDGYTAYMVKRKNYYLGKEWPCVEKMPRLFLKNRFLFWQGKIHESPRVEGKMGELHGLILHFTHRSLEEMVDKTVRWSKIEAELLFKANHPPVTWWRIIRMMISRFFYYFKHGGWGAGGAGLIESIYQSYSVFITYARLWEMQNEARNKNEELRMKN